MDLPEIVYDTYLDKLAKHPVDLCATWCERSYSDYLRDDDGNALWNSGFCMNERGHLGPHR